jgi:hypothetical protein
MRRLFDTIFYQSYIRSQKGNERSRRNGVPWHVDAIFNAIWDLSIIQACVVIGIVNILVAILGYKQEVDAILLYIWGGILSVLYVYNEFYYRRSKRYKAIIGLFSNAQFRKMPVLFIAVCSLSFGLLSVFLLKYS